MRGDTCLVSEGRGGDEEEEEGKANTMADGGFCVHRGLSCTARAFVSLGPRSLFLEAWGKKVFLSEASYDRKL